MQIHLEIQNTDLKQNADSSGNTKYKIQIWNKMQIHQEIIHLLRPEWNWEWEIYCCVFDPIHRFWKMTSIVRRRFWKPKPRVKRYKASKIASFWKPEPHQQGHIDLFLIQFSHLKNHIWLENFFAKQRYSAALLWREVNYFQLGDPGPSTRW